MLFRSDNGTGGTISRVETYATNSGANWRVFIRVRTETGWVTVNSTYGRLTAFAKCA